MNAREDGVRVFQDTDDVAALIALWHTKFDVCMHAAPKLIHAHAAQWIAPYLNPVFWGRMANLTQLLHTNIAYVSVQ